MNGNNNQQGPGFTLEEIGQHFGRLLGQAFALEITLTKQIATLQADNAALSAEVDRLRRELHQAQTDLLAMQGKAVIDGAKQKTALKDGL